MSESRTERRTAGLDTPTGLRHGMWNRLRPNPDAFGQLTEGFARFMGTPQFLLWMTLFCAIWLGWNTWGPEALRFDDAAIGFTALTLMLSLQASYAAPLLLLAQNRQDDRDRVIASQDRKRDQENLEETQYLTREIAALRIALREVATRDYVRSELRDIMEELQKIQDKQNQLDQYVPEARDPLTGSVAIVTEESRKKKKVKDVDESEHGSPNQ